MKRHIPPGLFFCAILFLLSFLAVRFLTSGRPVARLSNAFGKVQFAQTALSLEFAGNREEREQGLSGRAFLPKGSGMLFLFPAPDFYGIWMNDMHFPLDIVWLDAAKRVVDLKENALPSSYPQIFKPSSPARYVLEVNAGFVAEHHVVVGDVLSMNQAR